MALFYACAKDRMRLQPFKTGIDGLGNQPRSRQVATVPEHRHSVILHNFRIPLRRHFPFIQFVEIRFEKLQPMRGMPEQISLQENICDRAGQIGLHSFFFFAQKSIGKCTKIPGTVSNCHGLSLL